MMDVQNCNVEDVISRGIAIHYGVVGNMQASHVCAPGSIPGDGTFYMRKKREGEWRRIGIVTMNKEKNQ